MNPFFRICLPLVTALLTSSALAQNDPDSGISKNVLLRVDLNDDWYLSSINNFASKDGLDQFAIGYMDLTLGHQFDKHWSIDAGYRHAWIDIIGEIRNEHRPLINISRKDFIEGWFLLNRSRLELRLFEDPMFNDRFRFRHHFLAVSPWKIPGTTGRWFVEEELFYEFTSDNFNMNWLTTGFRFKLAEGVFFKVGYRWHNQKINNDWRTRHVGVTGLIMRF